MDEQESRWVLPDKQAVLRWCKKRNNQDIRCILDVLGEDVKTAEQVEESMQRYPDCAQAINEHKLDSSLAVKLTSLGAISDKTMAIENLLKIYEIASKYNIRVELDMEGAPLVGYTLKTALESIKRGYNITLALQAYLDRTSNDLEIALKNGITIRLVKGAYLGDTNDFQDIHERFKKLVELLLASGKPFSVGTHDPELIDWLKTQAIEQQDLIEFGFLKGLADVTKLELAGEGWAVSEYVPFGKDSKAYILRRERYLNGLEGLMRQPAP